MIRNLKVLGLAVVAVFAMTAIAASAASAAEPSFTADGYPAFLTGSDTPGGSHKLTGGGQEVTCEGTYEAELTATTGGTLTVFPSYANCESSGDRKATVTLNSCHYQFTTMEGEGSGDTWPVTSFVKCPTGQKIEIHIYKTTNEAEGVFCTLTVGQQGPLTGITIHLETASAARITGTVTAAAETHGECSFGLTANINVELHVDASVKCENEAKTTTNCDIG